MYALELPTAAGPVYWAEEHCTTRIENAKRFGTEREAQVERWNVAGTDFRIVEVPL